MPTIKKLYFSSGVDVTAPTDLATSAGGAGAVEINAVANSIAYSDTSGWSNGTSHTISMIATGSPLDPAIPTGFSDSASSTATESSTSGAYYSISTLAAGLLSKKLKLEFYYITEASQTWAVSVYAGATRLSLSTDLSGATTLPAGSTGKFTAYFDSTTATAYSVNLTRTAGSGTSVLKFTSVIVGPGIQPQGSVIGALTSYTPTFTGFGTVTDINFKYRREGSRIRLQGIFKTGTPTAVTAKITLPTGLSLSSTTYAVNKNRIGLGHFQGTLAADIFAGGGNGVVVIYDSTEATSMFFDTAMKTIASGNLFSAANGNFASVTAFAWIDVDAEIAEWQGSGVLHTAQNDIEYASVGGTWDAASTTTVFGQSGSLMGGALTAARDKTITWQNPVQATDRITIWGSKDAVSWFPINECQLAAGNSPVVKTVNAAGTVSSGVSYRPGATASETIVTFAQYLSMANDDAPTVDWPSANGYWVATKSKSGVAVGFGLANSTTSGLAPAQVFGSESGVIDLQEISVTPANTTSGAEAKIYLKSDKLILAFNDAGTMRYKYLDLTSTGVTWVHTTSAP